jgi:hypothetical protein
MIWSFRASEAFLPTTDEEAPADFMAGLFGADGEPPHVKALWQHFHRHLLEVCKSMFEAVGAAAAWCRRQFGGVI